MFSQHIFLLAIPPHVYIRDILVDVFLNQSQPKGLNGEKQSIDLQKPLVSKSITQLSCYFNSSSFITNLTTAVQQSNDTSTTIHGNFVANYDSHSLHVTTIIANHDETHYIY